jgi:hypothetical protein
MLLTLVSTIDSIYNLATAVEDRDHHRFLVHVDADILDVATWKDHSRSVDSFRQGKMSSFRRFAYLLL